MNMSEYLALCKQKSYELKETHPNLKHSKLLDLAAQELGFKHFTTIVNLEKILPPDEAPSHLAIVMAGGNADDSPYTQVSNSYTINSSNAVPVSSSVTSNQSKAIPMNTSVTSKQSNAIPMNSSVTSNQSNATPVSNFESDFIDDGSDNFPRQVTIQQTPEAVIKELGYDPADSENEDSISLVDWEIGGSIEEGYEIESWSDIPKGYELSSDNSEKDFEDFNEWLFLNTP